MSEDQYHPRQETHDVAQLTPAFGHFWEQARRTILMASPTFAAMYDTLIEHGMPEERAFEFTEKFMETLLRSAAAITSTGLGAFALGNSFKETIIEIRRRHWNKRRES